MIRSTRTLHAFSGFRHLPVFECDKANILKLRRQIRPLCNSSTKVSFHAWRLAHAVKKADCARWPLPRHLWLGTAGFLLEQLHLFDWNSRELRLNEGMSDYYADFTRTSISGRVAQGMTLLFVEDQGYSYFGRFEAVFQQYAPRQASGSTMRRLGRLPDFILESGSKGTALAEAKGGFVPLGGTPDIKGALRDALDQLNSGGRLIAPRPHRSFAVGTFIREVQDCSEEPSLIAFVDPEPDEPRDPVEIPPDAIRRANYAPWLSLMRFDGPARRLLAREGGSQRYPVPILTLGEHQYVFTVASILPWYGPYIPDRDLWGLIWECPEWPLGLSPGSTSLEIVGLDLKVVQALGMAIRGQRSDELIEMNPEYRGDVPSEFDGGEFYGSVFSDGSLLGEIRIPCGGKRTIEWTEIEL